MLETIVEAPQNALKESAGKFYNPGERQRCRVVGKCNARPGERYSYIDKPAESQAVKT